ncbi:vancomycin aglycone glucosyltransferase [Actinoplanes octamycinicus]|uniref:Vancomycin aglycone glucosyltransferase n=1 Tax=Actinoplanes octamycinicus TaxID=135948 RepID=A0A7W7GZS9_9ACTN|nr:glycosyltransferase [Actinoplanes octamycinicus]MBB4741308.1 vancomycin aglycone glucosyltransferase [Actinoplanes octamycinicus]GIE62892.1 glycosyl transferase [Actinoplanes octamycinicus]
MHVVLSTYDSRGGVEPLIGLAVRLQGHGVRVTVGAPADDPERFAAAGVTLLPVGEPVRAPKTGTIRDRAAALIAEQFAKLPEADLIVATGILPSVLGARSVAESRGIPYVYAAFQPNSLPSPHHAPITRPGVTPAGADNRALWEQDARAANELFRDLLNAERAGHGLPPVGNVRDHGFTELPWLATDSLLGPWPEPSELEVVQTGTWILPDEGPLSDELEDFLDDGEPPVYVGFGSMPMGDAGRAAVEAVRAQGHRVILSRGWAGLEAEDCLVIGEASHPALFRRVAAVVHHGGSGTTHTAARAGAPQVIVPYSGDQPYWASRVTALGIGAASSDGSIETALKTALSPETAATAAAVAAAMVEDGAAVAAEMLIEEYRR